LTELRISSFPNPAKITIREKKKKEKKKKKREMGTTNTQQKQAGVSSIFDHQRGREVNIQILGEGSSVSF